MLGAFLTQRMGGCGASGGADKKRRKTLATFLVKVPRARGFSILNKAAFGRRHPRIGPLFSETQELGRRRLNRGGRQ